jgi:hypothetical protein
MARPGLHVDQPTLEVQAKERATRTIGELAERGRQMSERLDVILTSLAHEDAEYREVHSRLSRSNSNFPVGVYTDFHTEDWSTGGNFLSSSPGQTPDPRRIYRSLTDEEKDTLIGRWQTPTAQTIEEVSPDVNQLIADVAGGAVIIRRLSGFADTLQQLGEAIQPPWSETMQLGGIQVLVPAWAWRASLPLVHPLYKQIHAIRVANIGTLKLVREKVRRVTSLLDGVLQEIPLSSLLAEPISIPQTLIVTTIGEHARISNSAIGADTEVSH